MNKVFKYAGLALAVFAVIGGIFIITYWNHIRSFPQILSAFYAKEYCSCYYNVKPDEEFCRNVARQYIPISSFRHNKEEQTVTVTGLGRSTTTQFISPQYGCRYLENGQMSAPSSD